MKYLEGQIRIPSGCAISALISREGRKISGETIAASMVPMHDRSNGLGGGFAGYGIYPEYKDFFALHIFYPGESCRKECESMLRESLDIVHQEPIPTRAIEAITQVPLIYRYFAAPLQSALKRLQIDERELIARLVMEINGGNSGAFIFSCGKNVGVFKGVGYPEDVAEFYRLEDYKGYCWTAHGRYPTNTPGWWGGAHPFALLDYTVVHNGEISSYDANRRSIEMYGYRCTLQTDTEVITYIADYLLRKQGLTLQELAQVMAAPFFTTISRKSPEEQKQLSYLRTMFPGFLVTGPFSIILAYEGGLMALNDRLKLRSLVGAEKGDMVYLASEEAAIRVMEPNPDRIFYPTGGEPVIVQVKGGAF